MADKNVDTDHMTEKQKVKEITDKLQEGLKELFESEKYKSYLSTMSKWQSLQKTETPKRPRVSLRAKEPG